LHGGASLRGRDHPSYRHGIYSRYVSEDEMALVRRLDPHLGLDQEIKFMRVFIGRLFEQACRLDDNPLPVVETSDSMTPQGRVRMVRRRWSALIYRRLVEALDALLQLVVIRHQIVGPQAPAQHAAEVRRCLEAMGIVASG
jgi:hypothetical protein